MEHTISPDEYQQIGKRYYKQKQYQKAIEAFTSGIEAAVRPPISLFDYRAASYDKLEVFNSALKDGREMIRLDQKDVKGYLRVGSILQKVGKLDKAIGIYKYGMKNVPVDNRNFQVLQQLHDKLTRQLSPAKAIDPFTILPVELVEMIISYLSFRQLVSCLRVCKGWKIYLTRCPNLWAELDLSYAKRDVSRVFVRNAINWSGARIKKMVVYRFRHPDILRNIATACKGLEEMVFLKGGMLADTVIEVAQCGQNLRKLVLHTDVSFDTVAQILRFRPTLEHAEFSSIVSSEVAPIWKGHYSNLKFLGLTYNTQSRTIRGDSVQKLLLNTPNLEYLRVDGRATLDVPSGREFADLTPNLKEYMHRRLSPFEWPGLAGKVKKLDLKCGSLSLLPTAFTSPAEHRLRSIWETAQASKVWELDHLSLQAFHDISPEFLSVLLDHYVNNAGEVVKIKDDDLVSNLQRLSMRDCIVLSGTSLFGLNGLLTCSRRILSPALQYLDLSGLGITDGDIEALITHHMQLRSIDLSRTNITGAGVKALVDSISTLELVNADDCSKISSRDIVAYAKGKGVTMSMKMMDVKSGKKVRY